MAFWEPVLRSWLTSLPLFVTGILTFVIQLRRLRQHVTTTVSNTVKTAVAQQLGQAQDAEAGRHAAAQAEITAREAV